MLITTRYIVLVLVLLLVVYLAFLDRLAKPLFESQASEFYGAEVTVDSLEISPFLGRITLYNLQVANRSNPMRNLADARRAYLDIDMFKLADNVFEIDELDVDGLVLFRPRESEAQIIRPLTREGSAIDKFGLPSFELPDPDVLIARQRELLDRDIREIERAFTETERKWQLKMAELPTAEQVERYRVQVEQLRIADTPEKRTEVSDQAASVYADINRSIEGLRNLQMEYRGDLENLRDTVNRANQLANIHSEQLIDSLGLSNAQTAQLGSRLLQGDLSGVVQQIMVALSYTGSTAAEQGDPIYIHHGTISGPLLPSAVGLETQGELRNFAWPLNLAPEPSTLTLVGNTPDGGSVEIMARLDHRAAGPDDAMQVRIENLPLRDMQLSGSENLALVLDQALSSADGGLRLLGDSLSGVVTQRFSEVQFETRLREGAGDAARLIAAVLERNNEFDFAVGLTGTLAEPRMHFSSNLDQRIQATVRNAVADRLTTLTNGLQNRISNELGPQIGAARKRFEQLAALSEELEQSLTSLGQLSADP